MIQEEVAITNEMNLQTKIDTYKDMINNGKYIYMVKKKFNNDTDIIIDDKKIRYEISDICEQITDIYNIDLMFDYVKYDIYINFFHKTKKLFNKRDKNYITKLTEKYVEIIKSTKFRTFYLMLLGIDSNDKIDLQLRYLSQIQKFFERHIDKVIVPFFPNEDCIDMLIKNYSNVIEHFKYTSIVKFVNDETDICIYSEKIREHVFALQPHLDMLYEFEDHKLKEITNIIKINHVIPKVSNSYKRVPRTHIENIIYKNDNCINDIKAALNDKVNLYNKYVNIIIQNIYSTLNFK